jgi:hypothetical protein
MADNNPIPETWNDTQRILAFVIVAALIVVILIWIFHPPTGDAASNAVLNVLVGALVGMAGTVATFYFGSSKGSKDKDDTINTAVKTAAIDTSANPSSTLLPKV